MNGDFLIITSLQLVIIAVLVTMLFQMLFAKSYFLFEILLVVYCSFSLAFIYLLRLFGRFYRWYLSKRNLLFLLYCVLFAILITNFLSFLAYLTVELYYHSPTIKPSPTPLFFMKLSSPLHEIQRSLNLIYDILTLMSFVVAWITTVVLLNGYSKKIGLVKYWFLICIPLIYFLSRYDALLSPVLQYLGLSVQFNVLYLIFLSATQQIGGVSFGIYYWISSRKVKNQKLKNYLILSAIGMMFIFAANEIHGLLIAFFPPFGLITVSFMGLGSFLLYLGIFDLAALVARNSEIRTNVNRRVEELSLVKNIGRSEIERVVAGQVELASKSIPEDDSDMRSYEFEEVELKQLVQDVMNEVNSKKGTQPKVKSDKV